jgi:hypothetical protein
MKNKGDDIVVGPALMTFLIGSIVVASTRVAGRARVM